MNTSFLQSKYWTESKAIDNSVLKQTEASVKFGAVLVQIHAKADLKLNDIYSYLRSHVKMHLNSLNREKKNYPLFNYEQSVQY